MSQNIQKSTSSLYITFFIPKTDEMSRNRHCMMPNIVCFDNEKFCTETKGNYIHCSFNDFEQ